MKPIAKPGDTILQIFDSNDDDDVIYRLVTDRSAWRTNQIMLRVLKSPRFKGYSYRVDSVAFNSKYNVWTPPVR